MRSVGLEQKRSAVRTLGLLALFSLMVGSGGGGGRQALWTPPLDLLPVFEKKKLSRMTFILFAL